MGWLYTSSGSHKTATSYLDAQFTYERTDEETGEKYGLRVLRSACVGNRVYYAAAQQFRGKVVNPTFAIVCLVRWNPRNSEGLTIGYKDMDESMGPYEAECPLNILEMLGSTDCPSALQWRRKCLMRHLRRAARPRLENGMRIKFASPIKFTDGYEGDEFVVFKEGRRTMLGLPGNSRPSYRCSRLTERPFSVVHETRVMTARI